jgi:predicted dinucleotide-binding enzyme
MIKSIGIIGAGIIGTGIARHALRAGLAVTISNSRGPSTLRDVVAGLSDAGVARAVPLEEAAEADLVVLAVPFSKIPTVGLSRDSWEGHLVLDTTNQFAHENPYGGRAQIGDLTGSEWVAAQLPGATVIKAFNAMYGTYVAADPVHLEGRQIAFYAADESDGKSEVAELLGRFGFAPVDVGSLREGGKLMQLDGYLNGLHAIKQD